MDHLRKIRDSLRVHGSSHGGTASETDSTHDGRLSDSLAFDGGAPPPDIEGVEHSEGHALRKKAKIIQHAIAHPYDSVKLRSQNEFLKVFVLSERPWLVDQVKGDEQLWDAYTALRLAEEASRLLPNDDSLALEVSEAAQLVKKLNDQREELAVAWHMSRFVRRVRVVGHPLAFPVKDPYDPTAPYASWIKWVGHIAFYGFQTATVNYVEPTNDIAYDREALISIVERLIIASQAYQYWWMRVRSIYRWENPWVTFKWLLLYLFLLKTGYFMTAFWIYLLYSLFTNRYGATNRAWTHESNIRASQTQARAAMLCEQIIRHGPDDWVEPFLDEFGPWLQEQLLDLAQFLEICSNYYSWRNSTSNFQTCVAYIAVLLVSAIPDVKFSIKIFWMACGVYFFMCRPVASLYPRFRHIIDPMRWFFWHIPTTSEHCFLWIREHAISSLKPTVNNSNIPVEEAEDDEVYFDCPSTSGPIPRYVHAIDEPSLCSFRAHWSGRRGCLEVTRSTIRFVTHGSTPKTEWTRSLATLLELRKLSLPLTDLPARIPSATLLSKSSAALSILWFFPDKVSGLLTTEETPNDASLNDEEILYAMDTGERDEVFNTILGLSGATWMELQREASFQTRVG